MARLSNIPVALDPKVKPLDPVKLTPEQRRLAFSNREEWLNAAAQRLRPWLASRGYTLGNPYLSVGELAVRGDKAIGRCWSTGCSDDGRGHIFVSARLTDPVEVLAVLLHELGHDIVGVQHGHRKPFSQFCQRVGLVKPWTATTPSPDLRVFLAALAEELGAYPHAALTHVNKKKKQPTRMRKYECPGCGQIVRAASDTLSITCNDCEVSFVLVEGVKVGED